MKSSTCHIGQEQLAKPAMLPSSCSGATRCSTQLLEGWPRHKAGDGVTPVAKSVEGGQGGLGSQDWHGGAGWVQLVPCALVVDGGKGGEAEARRMRRRRKSRKKKATESGRAGRERKAVEKFKQERSGGEK